MSNAPSHDPGLPAHGGDLADAQRRFGIPHRPWLDLSTGINPWPYAVPVLDGGVFARLPGEAEQNRLREAAAGCYGAPGPEWVSAGAGSQAFIQCLPRLVPTGRIGILAPTYNPHEQAWRMAGHDVAPVGELSLLGGCDHAIIVNPNNPDGRAWEADELLRATAGMRRAGGILVVDEAFADCAPERSLAGRLEDGVVVLRSFGKFFGLAGLRLGFALAVPDLGARLREVLGPWPVSGPAIAIGTRALGDTAWIAATRARLAAAARDLEACLSRGGLHVIGGTNLFKLCVHRDAAVLWHRLGRAGILVRAFPFDATWLRVGLPAGEDELARLGGLLEALGSEPLGAGHSAP